MPEQTLVQRFTADLDALRRDVAALQSQSALANTRADIDDLERRIGTLPGAIAGLKARGFLFSAQLEAPARELDQRWQGLRQTVMQQLTTNGWTVEGEQRSLEAQVAHLSRYSGNPSAGESALAQTQMAAKALAAKVDSIQRSLHSIYDPLASDLGRFEGLLKQTDWMLDQMAEASFSLELGEGGVRAVKAAWVRGERSAKDDPQGVLCLTNRRLLFEQKQEVATKKVLFITTEKQKVQKLVLDLALSDVATAEAKKMGLMGHEDHLGMSCAAGAPVERAHFHLDGQDCHLWQTLLMQVRRGETAHLALA